MRSHRFMNVWQQESAKTIDLLKSLPSDQDPTSDPTPMARSLGELAWHLAESDAYITFGIERGQFALTESNRPVSSGRGKWSCSLRRTSAFTVKPSSV